MRGLWIQIILITVSWSFAFLSLRMHDTVIKYLYAMMNILQVRRTIDSVMITICTYCSRKFKIERIVFLHVLFTVLSKLFFIVF